MGQVQIIDTFPRFRQLSDSSDWNWQEETYIEYLEPWPELLEKQKMVYENEDICWKETAHERIFPFIPSRYEKMIHAHQILTQILPMFHEKLVPYAGNDIDLTFVIYVGLGVGAGWATTYAGRPACMLGLENIAELHWDDERTLMGLCGHESGHLIHYKLRDQAGTGKGRRLYEEGFAQRMEHILAGCHTWHEQNGQGDWLEWCTRNRAQISKDYLESADEDVRHFFGSWLDYRGYKQTGYYLGHELMLELEQRYTLHEIAGMDIEKIEKNIRAILTEFSKS